MKIGIDISQIAYAGTGVACYTKELVRSIISLDSENTYVLFGMSIRKKVILEEFCKEISVNKKNVDIKLFFFPLSITNKIWNQYHIVNVEKLIGKIDVFHSSDWIQPPSEAKKITTIHDLVIYKYPELSHPYIVETQKKRLEWVKKECDQIITDSYSSGDDLESILNIKHGKISVIYPGISNKFKPSTTEEIAKLRKKYSLNNEYILAVGTIEPRKNLKTVIDAYEKFIKHSLISSRKKEIELVIAGNMGWEKNLEKKDNIRYLGFVMDEDMPALYSAALIFVFPSFYEGFGFPVIEAMACGCPTVTSNRGSLKEVAGCASILVDPMSSDDLSHKLVQIVIDEKLRNELIKKGFVNAEKYTWNNTALKTIELYKKISNEKNINIK